MYNTKSLKHGIEQANKNIEIFKEAIKKEQETIASYEEMIFHLERKREMAEMKDKLEENPDDDQVGSDD